MAITLASDMKVYNDQFFGGMVETLQQAVEDVVSSSRGAITMTTDIKRGDYDYESFFKKVSGIVNRQDITSTSAATPTKFTQDENIAVKLHRRIGPHDVTRKSFNQIGQDPGRALFVFGQQVAIDVLADMVNTGLAAASAALVNQAAVLNDVTGASVKTCTHTNLLRTLAKFGDRANRIVAWVMHSTQFYDLAVQGIEDQIDSIAADVIRAVNVPGLGRPFIVTDSDSLIVTGDTPDSYYVLGLTEEGLKMALSEEQYVTVDEITGAEQLYNRIQGEYAYNLGVKGFKWDVSNGGANPDSSALATGSNWDKTATSSKDLAGVVLKCQAAS